MTTASRASKLIFIKPSGMGTYAPILAMGDVAHESYVATPVERPVAGLVGVAYPALHAEQRTTTGWTVGLVGSGTPGVAPTIAPALKACAMNETITEDVSVTYNFVDLIASTETDGVDILVNESGEEQQSLNNRGTAVLTFPAAGMPAAEFSMTGDYATPYNEGIPPPPDFSGQSLFKTVGQNTTLTLIIDDEEYSVCFENLSVTLGPETQVFSLGGCTQSVQHTNIITTWSATIMRPAIDDLNLWEVLENRSQFDILLKHGIWTGPTANPGYRVTLELEGAFLDARSATTIKDKSATTISGGVTLNQLSLIYD